MHIKMFCIKCDRTLFGKSFPSLTEKIPDDEHNSAGNMVEA